MEENLIRFRKDVKIAFIDLETFNLNLNFLVNRPWQIGVLKVVGSEIIEIIDVHVKWIDCLFKIGEGAIRQTHFNEIEHNKIAIDPKIAFERFWPALEDADYIIGHNLLRFDLYLLRGYAQYIGRDWKFLVPKIIDTKSFFQGIKLNRPYNSKIDDFLEYSYRMANDHTKGVKTRIEILAKENNIEYDSEGLHNAIYDLKINKKLWDILKYKIEL